MPSGGAPISPSACFMCDRAGKMLSAGAWVCRDKSVLNRRGQTPEVGSIPTVPGGDHLPGPARI